MTITELQTKANELRLEAVRMVHQGGDGHPGPALSIADIITALYFEIMNIDPSRPDWEDRDRLILSKGHSCPILYAALSSKGYFGAPVEDYKLRALGSIFQGHPVMGKTPGVDMTSGSLGNGIALGAGMALAAKLRKKDFRVYVIVGDGELQEGIIWEGAQIAAAHCLDNLTVFVDKNNLQSGGSICGTIRYDNAAEKFAAFNWQVQEICGHDFGQILGAAEQAKKNQGRPQVIVCDCIKGKGLPFMENDNSWHKGVPSKEQYEEAAAILGGQKNG